MASIKPVNGHPECSRSLNSDAMAPFVAKTREVSPLEMKTPEPFSARVVFCSAHSDNLPTSRRGITVSTFCELPTFPSSAMDFGCDSGSGELGEGLPAVWLLPGTDACAWSKGLLSDGMVSERAPHTLASHGKSSLYNLIRAPQLGRSHRSFGFCGISASLSQHHTTITQWVQNVDLDSSHCRITP